MYILLPKRKNIRTTSFRGLGIKGLQDIAFCVPENFKIEGRKAPAEET